MDRQDFIKDELFASETKVKRESSKVQMEEVKIPNRRKAQNLLKTEKPEKPKIAKKIVMSSDEDSKESEAKEPSKNSQQMEIDTSQWHPDDLVFQKFISSFKITYLKSKLGEILPKLGLENFKNQEEANLK